eukprot:TRINITY_DN62909_c0_g1_i1.p1 TRINITY_DN62909_c0_g1~~TRINITY_DN62909_c0_g1_i1.p1  ORF type:complete len:314 (-),score=39.67 TRINITY_DN62909_c0_g1_i1:29-970(-)
MSLLARVPGCRQWLSTSPSITPSVAASFATVRGRAPRAPLPPSPVLCLVRPDVNGQRPPPSAACWWRGAAAWTAAAAGCRCSAQIRASSPCGRAVWVHSAAKLACRRSTRGYSTAEPRESEPAAHQSPSLPLQPPLAFVWTVPNVLTLGRLALVPAMVTAWFLHMPTLSAQLFAAAAVTDAADGYIARRWPSQRSAWGAFMDPVADKVLVCCALLLVSSTPAASPLVSVSSMVIVSREIAVSSLREFAARNGQPIAVDNLGKAKMVVQCIGLGMLLSQHSEIVESWGTVALGGAALLSVASAWNYARPLVLRR